MRVFLRTFVYSLVILALAGPGCKKKSSSGPSGPPGRPTGVTATPGNQQVTIDWNTVPRALSYTIYWDVNQGVTPQTGTPISVAAPPYVHIGLTNGTTYYYVVTALNSRGESGESFEVSATPNTGGTPPNPPTGVGATPGDQQATIGWNPSPGATSYNIYWDTNPGVTIGSGTPISGATSPYLHTGLTNGTTYYYVVTALNIFGQSAESSEVSATPSGGGTPPTPPTGVAAIPGDTEITISFNPVAGATSYNLYWDTNPGVTILTGNQILGIANPYTHMGLTNGTPYYYVVTALNGFGESLESVEVSATPVSTGSQTATVDISGVGTVTFAGVDHYYDPFWPGPGIYMDNSTPPGYIVNIFWDDPITDPGCPFDTCSNPLYVDVTTPSNDFWENPCTTDVSLCVTQYATSIGGQTVGTFSGDVEEVFTGSPVITLTSGSFTAVRSY